MRNESERVKQEQMSRVAVLTDTLAARHGPHQIVLRLGMNGRKVTTV